MAWFFQLFKKDSAHLLVHDPEAVEFAKVDEEICALLNVDVHPVSYCSGWFDLIGFEIARGSKLGSQELKDKVEGWYKPYPNWDDEDREAQKERMLKILKFLEDNYVSDSWGR